MRPVLRFAFVVLAHMALLWHLTRPVPVPVERDRREWLQVVLPTPPIPDIQVTPAAMSRIERPAAKARSAPPVAEELPTVVDAPVEQPEPASAPATNVIPPEVLRDAIKAAAAERPLRGETGRVYSPAPDSMGARLAKGFAAARAAVPPKLLEAPRTELISAPRDPKRIYRVTTALGEYCLYYPDKGSIAANSDPRSGRPEFGQPMASSCPIPF